MTLNTVTDGLFIAISSHHIQLGPLLLGSGFTTSTKIMKVRHQAGRNGGYTLTNEEKEMQSM